VCKRVRLNPTLFPSVAVGKSASPPAPSPARDAASSIALFIRKTLFETRPSDEEPNNEI
jgi:hypothetical protein